MELKVLSEHGYNEAMQGLALSYNQPLEKMPKVAEKLAFKGDGHNKFLRSIVLWLDVKAPNYWWAHEATYKVGITEQSDSIMHRKNDKTITTYDFIDLTDPTDSQLDELNGLLQNNEVEELHAKLPGGYLYRRIISLNYACLQNIIRQRKLHKISQWKLFIEQIREQVQFPQFLFKKEEKKQSYIDDGVDFTYIYE